MGIFVFEPKDGTSLEATHVVVGIDWGITQIFTCEYQHSDSENIEKGKMLIKEKLQILKDALKNGETKEKHCEEGGFSFSTMGDFKSDNKLSFTFTEALDMVKDLWGNPNSHCSGTIIPLSYKMMTLDSVLKICKISTELLPYSGVDKRTKDNVFNPWKKPQEHSLESKLICCEENHAL